MSCGSSWWLVTTGAVGAAVVYAVAVRPWHLTWGATPAEIARPMPGDDLVPEPQLVATRAISIAASTPLGWLDRAAMDAGDFVMMRRQLLTIRDRVEAGVPEAD